MAELKGYLEGSIQGLNMFCQALEVGCGKGWLRLASLRHTAPLACQAAGLAGCYE